MRISELGRIEERAVSALLALMVLCMLAEAVRRHVWPLADPWPIRAAGGCLAWTASLGMARAAALGLHFRMLLLTDIGSTGGRRLLARISDIAFLVFAAVSFGIGCWVFVLALSRDTLPSHPAVYAAIPAGSLLTMARLIQRLQEEDRE